MELQKVKEAANKCVDQARSLLVKDGYLTPVAISLREDGYIFPTLLKIENEQDKENLREQLWELSLTAEGIIVIIDSYVREMDKDEVVPTGSLKSDPDACDAIVCFAFVKGSTSIRQIRYKRANPQTTPIFFDQGWMDIGTGSPNDGVWSEGRLSNPFIN
jgi:hypothetical protein